MKRRLLICGGRTYNNKLRFYEIMEEIKPYIDMDNLCVIEGNAKGADSLAGIWAMEHGVALIIMPANWDYYGKSAGFIRNKWMIQYANPDLVIAFPGGRGTASMCKLAKQYHIDLYRVVA